MVDASGNSLGLPAGTTNYLYDGNGNVWNAHNSTNTGGNRNVTYNLLNLPLVVTNINGTITYTYDAAGNKLRKVSVQGGVTTYTDYISGIQYNGTTSETLQYIMTEEGQAAPNGTTSYDYQYFLGDNLGNTRESFGTKTGATVPYQRDDYYAFGMDINTVVTSPQNYYLYNKKELQSEFADYDYGARFYDPVVARWNTIDPLAEISRRWSTYNYVMDNPISLVDADGMKVDSASQDEWNKQKQAVTDQRDNLVNGINDLTDLSNSTGIDYVGLISGLQDRVTSLTGTLNNLTNLENSSQVYSLNPNSNLEEGIALNTSTKAIVLSYNGTANFVHESTHAEQFETGEIAFRSDGRMIGQDVFDETSAYKAQFAYDPSSVTGLTSSSKAYFSNSISPSWVQGLTKLDGTRPYSQGGENNTGISPVNINSNKAQLIKAYPGQAQLLQSLPENFILKSTPGLYYKH